MKARSRNYASAWLASIFVAAISLTGCDNTAVPDSNDPSSPAVTAGPAKLQLSQSSIDFGQIPMTDEVIYTINVVNTGSEFAELTGFEIAEGSIASFVSVDTDPWILDAGESKEFSFKFVPSSVATFNAIAKIHTQDGKQTWKVDLTGQATPCFYLEQAKVDFLEAMPACGLKTQNNKLFNKCNYPIQVNIAGTSTHSSHAAFEVIPDLRGSTIQPDSEIELTVKFDPSQLGDYRETWTLRTHPLQAGGVAETVQFDLNAKSVATSSHTDSITVSPTDLFTSSVQSNPSNQLDILILLDTTAQPMTSLFGIQMQTLFTQLADDGYDLRVGFLAPYLPQYECESQPGSINIGGALWPTDGSSPRILTPTLQNFSELIYSRLTTRDDCFSYRYTDGTHGLESATYALSSLGAAGMDNFVRTDAKLILMFLATSRDRGSDSPEAHAAQIRLTKSDPNLISAFSAVCVRCSNRYHATVTALGGLNQPLLQLDIVALKSFITQSPTSTITHTKVRLTRVPVHSNFDVEINGTVNTSWTYDATSNSVVFPSALSVGTSVQVQYNVGCE